MRLALLLLSLLAATGVAGAESNKYMGVNSCARSHCHGGKTKDLKSNVWLNEYQVWNSDDRHSFAYRDLMSDQSRKIAAKLGIASAVGSPLCLGCHALNVPQKQISDGIACEGCHGAAEKWLATHDDKGVDHKQNLRDGMYPMMDPSARARLCYGCHMGASDRFATHRILGAGHPRLSFELENFTANQPAHYTVDDDYRRRKGNVDSASLWLSGQVEGSLVFLSLLRSGYMQVDRWVPELGFYDCQSCHHAWDKKLRWQVQRRNQGLEPGALRLQDHHLRILEIVSDALTPGDTAELRGLVNGLVKAGQTSRTAIADSSAKLDTWIKSRRGTWQKGMGAAQVRDIRRRLLAQAASGTLVDYGTAEQGWLSIVALSAHLSDKTQVSSAIDDLFDSLGTAETFSPERYATTARRVEGRF